MHEFLITITLCSVYAAVALLIRRTMIGYVFPMDEGYHLVLRKMIKNDGFRCVRVHPNFLVKGKTKYPFLYHYLCAFIPDRLFEKIRGHLSLAINVLYCILIMLTLLVVQRLTGIRMFPAAAALLVPIVALSPENVGRLELSFLSQFSGRAFCRLLCGMYFLAICLFLFQGAWIWAAAALVLSGLLLSSSIFGFQASIIGSVLLGLFTLSVWPVVILIWGWLLATLVSRGKAIEIVTGNFQHWRVYFAKTQHQMFSKNKYKVPRPSHVAELVRLFAGAVFGLKKDNLEKAYRLLKSSPLLGVPGFGPFYFIVFYTWFEVAAAPAPNKFVVLLVLWCVAGFAAWVLTMLPRLKSFGEAERYVDYISFLPAMALLGIFFSRHPTAGWIFIAGYLIYSLFWHILGVAVHRESVRKRDVGSEAVEEVINYLRGEGGKINLLAIPRNTSCYFQYRLGVNVVLNMRALTAQEYDFLIGLYPFPPSDISAIVARYGVTHIVLQKINTRFSMKQPRETVFENRDYLVWRCRPENPEPADKFGETHCPKK